MLLNVLLPVYNEEGRLESGVRTTAKYLQSVIGDDCCITIVDNASTDATQAIAQQLAEEIPMVDYVRIDEKGVGAAIRTGARLNECSIVGYMDIDLSTDIHHLADMLKAFRDNPEVQMVNGSRWNRESDTAGRKWYRNISSHGLTFLLNSFLGMQATDAICGFKFFRKDALERLVCISGQEENGWFFVIEMLLRAERSGMAVYELPVRWRDDYNSTVDVVAVTRNYLHHIRRLRKEFRAEAKGGSGQ